MTATASAGRDERRVEVHRRLDDPAVVERFFGLYCATFAPLRTRAAARHLLSRAEWDAEMADERILKLCGTDGSGRVVALATYAQDLDALAWINPDFYRARYDRPVYYCGIALVEAAHQRDGWFSLLVGEMYRRAIADGAHSAFDCCAFNVDVVGLPDMLYAVGPTVGGIELEVVDVQRYYTVHYRALDDGAGSHGDAGSGTGRRGRGPSVTEEG